MLTTGIENQNGIRQSFMDVETTKLVNTFINSECLQLQHQTLVTVSLYAL